MENSRPVTHLTSNSIKNKIEKNDSSINDIQIIFQVVDHKVFDEANKKSGIKSR